MTAAVTADDRRQKSLAYNLEEQEEEEEAMRSMQ